VKTNTDTATRKIKNKIRKEKKVKQIKIRRSFILLAVAAFLAFPSYLDNALAAQNKVKQKKSPVIKNAGKVVELRNIGQLKEAFQRDAGKVRFVTILSPT
jgi:hypothetical protein